MEWFQCGMAGSEAAIRPFIQPGHIQWLTAPPNRRNLSITGIFFFYLGELSDLLAHLAVHLIVVQLLLNVREVCRSPVYGGARPGALCSLTGAWSHNETPRGTFPERGGQWLRACRVSQQYSLQKACQLLTPASHSSVGRAAPAYSLLENMW